MGYKILGFIVWQGVKLYLRRSLPDEAGRKAAIGGAGAAAIVAGLVIAGRQQGSS